MRYSNILEGESEAMFLWDLLGCVVASGAGKGGAVVVGVAAVMAQLVLSLYGEVRFLFATMGNRSLTVKVMVSAIPFLVIGVYAMVSAIAFGPFLFSPIEPYLADLMRSLTLTVNGVLTILVLAALLPILALPYCLLTRTTPLRALATFGVEGVEAVTLLFLYGALFFSPFSFSILTVGPGTVKWVVYGIFIVAFKDFLLVASLILGLLLRIPERKEPEDAPYVDRPAYYRRQVQRYLVQDNLTIGIALLFFGPGTSAFLWYLVRDEFEGPLSLNDMGGAILLAGFLLLLLLGFGGLGLLLVYRRLRPQTAPAYRKLLTMGDIAEMEALFYQEMVAGKPSQRHVGFNQVELRSPHFCLLRSGIQTKLSWMGPSHTT